MKRIDELGGVIASVKAVGDEVRHQVKENGDASAGAILSIDKLLKDSTPHITNATLALERGMQGLQTTIETSQPQVAEILSGFKTVLIDADGTIKGFQPVGPNLAGITDDFHSMTTDSKNKLHEIFYPPPVKGFFPNVKRVFSFVLTPIFEGARLYFSLRSLPVRIVQPIPVK